MREWDHAYVSKERGDEYKARLIVAFALPGAKVESHDEGRRDAMVDAIITYPDGRMAALQVVTDTDPGYRRVWSRITKEGGHPHIV